MERVMSAESERPAEPTGMLLVSLATSCPKCKKGEARRIPEWRIEIYRGMPADRVVETVVCSKCGAQYAVCASAYQRAG
jgi:hypothetical protein